MFPTESSLYFPVVERAISWQDKNNNYRPITTHKTLVRPVGPNREPVPLAIVKSTYGVVQNKELFQAFEEQMLTAYGDDCRDVTVVDKVSYQGALCLRDYRFPNIKLAHRSVLKGDSGICFRTIIVNGFGGAPVKVYTGGIDAFCTNGMIRGDFETIVRKHTSGITIGNLVDRFKSALLQFEKLGEDIKLMQEAEFNPAVTNLLRMHLSERIVSDIMTRTLNDELPVRGKNMWALYSALTYYASNDNFVPVRDSGADHKAATMLKREEKVRQITQSDEWRQMLQAA